MALYYVEAGYGLEQEQENVVVSGGSKDCHGSGLAESQALYVSALNVNGLTLATHTARLGETQDDF